MPNKTLLKQLAHSLPSEDNEQARKRWANHILQHKIKLNGLTSLIHADKKTAMRFSWLRGSLSEMSPEHVSPVIPYFFNKRAEITIPNFDRSLAKMLWLCGIPKDIEGEAVDQLFKWLIDPNITVMTKTYALSALQKTIHLYPELKAELVIAIEDQLGKNSGAFDKRAEQVLVLLNK